MTLPGLELLIGDEDGFHVTVREAFANDGGYDITIWRRNHGGGNFPVIRDKQKATDLAQYLYDTLLPEHIAEAEETKKLSAKLNAERAARPKPKPPRVPKNAPVLTVFVCSECGELTEERSDDRVYECGECGTTASGDEGRRCDQCNKFTAKVSETSCPDCGAAMDDAETVEVQRATDSTLVLVKKEKR